MIKKDRLPPKLPVVLSSKISRKISAINAYNQNNTDEISQWYDYIEGMIDYLSNPVIAWDYMGRHSLFPNGARFIRDFNYNIGYTIKTNSTSNCAYVYVFRLNLNPEGFGLRVPSALKENKIVLTESNLRRIIFETLKRFLYK